MTFFGNKIADLFSRRRSVSPLTVKIPTERRESLILRREFAGLTTSSTGITNSLPVSIQPKLTKLPDDGPLKRQRAIAIKRGLSALHSQRHKKRYQLTVE